MVAPLIVVLASAQIKFPLEPFLLVERFVSGGFTR